MPSHDQENRWRVPPLCHFALRERDLLGSAGFGQPSAFTTDVATQGPVRLWQKKQSCLSNPATALKRLKRSGTSLDEPGQLPAWVMSPWVLAVPWVLADLWGLAVPWGPLRPLYRNVPCPRSGSHRGPPCTRRSLPHPRHA